MATVDEGKRRRYERYPFSRAISYIAQPDRNQVFKGYVINISEAGLCFASSNAMEEGQEIGIRTGLPVPRREGIVVWRAKIDDTLYKAGVRFV